MKKIEPDDPIEFLLTERERTLVLDHTVAGPEWAERLAEVRVRGKHLVVELTLEQLEDLSRFVAGETHSGDDPAVRNELATLHRRIGGALDHYEADLGFD